MSKLEKRLSRLKERYDLNSQFIARPNKQNFFICNPTRKSISHGVELNSVNWLKSKKMWTLG